MVQQTDRYAGSSEANRLKQQLHSQYQRRPARIHRWFCQQRNQFSYNDDLTAGIGILGNATSPTAADADYLYFNVDPSGGTDYIDPQMIIRADGKVGIGTTAPGTTLDIVTPDGGGGSITGNDLNAAIRIRDPYTGIGNRRGIVFSRGEGLGYALAAIQPGVADTDWNTYLDFFTRQNGMTTRTMRLTENGNVGIGTYTPGSKLTVAGTIESTTGGIKFPDGTVQTTAATGSGGGGFWSGSSTTISYDGSVGIGTTNPGYKLTVVGHVNIGGDGNGSLRVRHVNGKSWESDATDDLFLNYGTGKSVLVGQFDGQNSDLLVSGKTGIGTTAPQYELDVVGTVRTCEVKVSNLQGWCDYVFEEDYELPALDEVEAYIKTNKHLMDIPSEAHVMEHGISLGEMDAALLKKVEELTLYVIEQNKIIERLVEENKEQEQLKQQIEALQSRVK